MRHLALIAAAACGQPVPEVVSTDEAVITALHFIREDPAGVSRGLDLDGYQSDTNDGRSCFKADFVSPDGTPGIDNELARLLPLVDAAGENAVEALLQGAIDEGRALMITRLVRRDDGLADLMVLRGMDAPLLGADKRILEGQTLALDPEPLLGHHADLDLAGPTIRTEPFELRMPVVVFSQLYEVRMPSARLELQLGEDGNIRSGMIAGGIPIEQLLGFLETASRFAEDFTALFGGAIRDSGDLDRDATGACTAMSAVVTFDAVRAFTFE
jgi:hypothetical protein